MRSLLAAAVGADHVLPAGRFPPGYRPDQAPGIPPREPAFVVRPGSTAEVAAVLRAASEHGRAVTARGSGTGLSGAAIPRRGGIVISFERMNRVLEIDGANSAAVVQPGVTLAGLDAAAAEAGLVYPVFPGEMSASLGGTIATNAGGGRAGKHGVTPRPRVRGQAGSGAGRGGEGGGGGGGGGGGRGGGAARTCSASRRCWRRARCSGPAGSTSRSAPAMTLPT